MIPWPLGCYRVTGWSMYPSFGPGDLVLAWRWSRPRVGDVVVVKTPARLIIKRLAGRDPAGIWLAGDNLSGSTDSHQQGAYPSDWLVAKVIGKLAASKRGLSQNNAAGN